MRTRAHAHTRNDTRRAATATPSPRRDNSRQLALVDISQARPDDCRHPPHVAKCCIKSKKVGKSFGGFKLISYLCRRKGQTFPLARRHMSQEKFIITGLNRLSGRRDQISRPMTREDAEQRLLRELENRRRQKYAAYTRLKVERLEAVQLTIPFQEQAE